LGIPAIVTGTLLRRPIFIDREEIVDLIIDIEAGAGRVLIRDGPHAADIEQAAILPIVKLREAAGVQAGR
jgi:hypothetical protein